MKNFISALAALICRSVMDSWERLRSGQFTQWASDISSRIRRSAGRHEHDRPLLRKSVLFIVAGLLLVIIALLIAVFSPSKPDAPRLNKLTAPAMRDANGNVWTLQLFKGQASFVGGKDKPGPPLTIKTYSEGFGNIITIGVQLEGRAGEKYGSSG